MYDVVALGELLVDFTESGRSPQGNPLFEANPGGAPCNVLSMLAGLGKKTAFIGKVGDDALGTLLQDALRERGIDTGWLLTDGEVHTTLAFVCRTREGDRDFFFYRNPGADMCLCRKEITKEMTENTKILHFGTLSMTHPEVEAATKKAVEAAAKKGALISFDPNLRPPLWPDMEKARRACLYGIAWCDILKISDNEICWLSGTGDYTEGVRWIRERSHAALILVSMGAEGSRAYMGDCMVEVRPFLREDTVETTGAGDCFCACVLNYVLDHGLTGLTKDDLHKMLLFANAAASIVTTRKGALRVMPGRAETEAFLRSREEG